MALLVYAWMSMQLCNQWVMGHVMLCADNESKYLQIGLHLEQIYKLVSTQHDMSHDPLVT